MQGYPLRVTIKALHLILNFRVFVVFFSALQEIQEDTAWFPLSCEQHPMLLLRGKHLPGYPAMVEARLRCLATLSLERYFFLPASRAAEPSQDFDPVKDQQARWRLSARIAERSGLAPGSSPKRRARSSYIPMRQRYETNGRKSHQES